MKPYNHLPGYLHRWRLLSLGRMNVRIHDILTGDVTPYLHNHPFWYVSIVLRGGYTERVLKPSGELEVVERAAGSVVYRTPRDYHRIDNVFGDCRTLFIAWDKSEPGQNWGLLKHRDIATPQGYRDLPDGVYRFSEGFRVRANGFWYALGDDPFHAWLRTGTLSVHQNPEPLSKDPVPINVII